MSRYGGAGACAIEPRLPKSPKVLGRCHTSAGYWEGYPSQTGRSCAADLSRGPPAPPAFRTGRVRILAEWPGRKAKLFGVQFLKDGFCVDFAYHPNSRGLLSRQEVATGQTAIHPNRGGVITSHRVKYSHHVDGRAHFSQDGKILTRVIAQSSPLTGTVQHIFSIELQGLGRFRPVAQRDQFGNANWQYAREPIGLHVCGRWLQIENQGDLARIHLPVTTTFDDGSSRLGLAFVPPETSRLDGLLILEVLERSERVSPAPWYVAFSGGFVERAGISEPESALYLIYPADHIDYLPSIDLRTNFRPALPRDHDIRIDYMTLNAVSDTAPSLEA